MIDLYKGDCVDTLAELIDKDVKVDLILTDPPYGSTNCIWDIPISFEDIWNLLYKIRRDRNTPILIFGQEPFSSKLRLSNIRDYRYDIYWEKERCTNIFQVKRRPGKVIENISVFYEKQPTYKPQMKIYEGPRRVNTVKDGKIGLLVDNSNKVVKEYNDTGLRYPTQIIKFKRDILTSNLHPTQKPVALLEYLIKTYTHENDVVLDFTMGSGSTGVACKNTNRSFIGIEKDDNYYNIALKRLEI